VRGQVDDLLGRSGFGRAPGNRCLITTPHQGDGRGSHRLTWPRRGATSAICTRESHSTSGLKIIQHLRNGLFDALWCQLLRESLDLPEVFSVAILDGGTREGIPAGRALLDSDDRPGARHVDGSEPCSTPTTSRTRWPKPISETERRRVISKTYNENARNHPLSGRQGGPATRNPLPLLSSARPQR